MSGVSIKVFLSNCVSNFKLVSKGFGVEKWVSSSALKVFILVMLENGCF